MNKRILFVTTIMRTVEAFLIPHIQFFIDKGFEVGVATNTDDGSVESFIEMGVTVHHVSFSRSMLDWKNIKAYTEIRSVCKEYDMIHVHTPIASFLTRMASSKKQCTIYTAHGFHYNEQESSIKNLFYKTMEKIGGMKTSQLIVTNKDDLSVAKKWFPSLRVAHVHGVGIDTQRFDREDFTAEQQATLRGQLGIPSHVKVITHIAEFNENKRQLDLVETCEQLKEWDDNFVILLVGKGPTKLQINEEIHNRKLEKHIKCIGFVKNIPALLNISDIGLLVSLREGLPRSIMEMMSMEIPVVATNIRGNRDLIDDGENGYLVPVKSPSEIAKKCFQLLQDEELAKKMGQSGREKMQRQFALPIILDEMESIYKELIDEWE